MRLGYLSGALRVSTHPDVGAGGPRAHVFGVIRAFEVLGWEVKPFILGNRIPARVVHDSESFIKRNLEGPISDSRLRPLMADVSRLTLGIVNAPLAWWELSGQVDWVYERSATMQSLGWVFQRRGIPWILEINSPLFDKTSPARKRLGFPRLASKIETTAYRRCDALVCVSKPLKNLLVQATDVDPDKILVVPDGADTAFFDPLQHPTRRIFSGLTVGFVGNLNTWQGGLDLLLRVIAKLREEGRLINLVVVGDGPGRIEWESLAQSLNLAEQVHFTGRVAWDEVPSYIAGFDIGYSGQIPLQSGIMYLSPIKLYEYMAMAKPVLAAAFEDASMLIEGKSSGFLFQPRNEEDLKRALRDVYQARDVLPKMGDLARQEILERHSWVARIREMIPQVEAILRKKSRR